MCKIFAQILREGKTLSDFLLIIVAAAGILACAYAFFSYFSIKKLEEGTETMVNIAGSIRSGANTFIKYELKVVAVIGAVIAAVLGVLIGWQTMLAFVLGGVVSASAGWVGLKVATYANVRVANRARTTGNLGRTLKVALRGGSVMGLCVAGFALLGALVVYAVFGLALGQISDVAGGRTPTNWLGLSAGFTMTLSGYALGCSVIALFNRVGGGIYTKAADMGADLVGKTEEHIPEDDPRNPAVIADNVGDNVGDVAGLGSDLLESYVGAILSGVILACEQFLHGVYASEELLRRLMLFPVIFAACGLVSCIAGLMFVLLRRGFSKHPSRELNMVTWASAALTVIFGCLLSYFMFRDCADDISAIGFRVGAFSPWLAAVLGIFAGIAIGFIAEYYTSYDFKPTQKVAGASREGPALTVTQGMATGMVSCMLPVIVLAAALFGSYAISGYYGIACVAMGMLSFVAATVSVDTYGPISDNAGGIAEMSGLESSVREITDKLDSVGNTTAAVGKGFSIGSAALAATSLMISYMYAFSEGSEPSLDIIDPLALCGALAGAALPFMFSGMLIESVAKAARGIVDEVRRQFREIAGLKDGKAGPDYNACIKISSQNALRGMKVPCILAVVFPLAAGFIFGGNFVGGLLIGATLAAVILALYAGNAGGSWDNAKKYIEAGGLEGCGKGSPAHDASVVGDTVGDPLKDTVGPSLNILIKIMSTISLVAVAIFSQYNLFGVLGIS